MVEIIVKSSLFSKITNRMEVGDFRITVNTPIHIDFHKLRLVNLTQK